MPSCAARAQATPVEHQTKEDVWALLEQALCVLETNKGTNLPPDNFTLLEYVIRTDTRCYHTKVEPPSERSQYIIVI